MRQPFDQDFRNVLALYGAGRFAEAEVAAQSLASAYPTAAPAYNILGVIQASRGDPDAAVASLGKALTLDPRSDEAHYNLGLAHCARADFAAAADSFRASLRLNPGKADAAANLGNVLRALGAPEEACVSYRRALEAGGIGIAEIHNNLGAALSDMGRTEDAAVSFRRATELRPGYADAHLNLGRTLLRQGRLGDALVSLQRAVECAPGSPDALIMFANTLRDLGRLEQASVAYRRALELRPGDRQALYHLGLSLLDLGRHAEGLEAIARGPGIANVSLADARGPGDRTETLERIDLATGDVPNFVGAWVLPEPAVCDRLVELFESPSALHFVGRTDRGVDQAAKNSSDMTILPNDLGKPGYEAVANYLRQLEICYRDYAQQWPHFSQILSCAGLVPFNIQRYREGGHFQRVHAERTSFGSMHRVLAWMTYLNDVGGGGTTRFHHYGLDVRPQRGKTLIWPAEWTHVHSGEVVTAGTKYIITGWMHFPHDRNGH